MFTEGSGSEIENFQSTVITAFTDKLDVVDQDPNGNCLFKTLSAGWFGSPIYFTEVRESIWDLFYVI